jgi:hypothetical protein
MLVVKPATPAIRPPQPAAAERLSVALAASAGEPVTPGARRFPEGDLFPFPENKFAGVRAIN